MRYHELETRPQVAPRLLRQGEKDEEKQAEAQGLVSRQYDRLAQLHTRTDSKPGGDAQVAALRRSVTDRPFGAASLALRLQRTYGNRYARELIARAAQGDQATEVAPEVEGAIQAARGSGQALDSGVRAQMESAFGADFGGVRVHADAHADTLSRGLSARAFTTGQDIFFKQGEYNPAGSTGRELLAHELTHVVQQNGDQVHRKLTVNRLGDMYEQEAEQMAQAIMQREQHSASTGADQGQVHRQAEEEDKEEKTIQAKVGNGPVQPQTEEREVEEKDQSFQAKTELDWVQQQGLDVLSEGPDVPDGPYVDQVDQQIGTPTVQRANGGPAHPTELIQILTDWTPGANRYGFQLKFRCRSTSGRVQDLQDQAPNLILREYVTYSKNDFSHRINPSDPTILPPGGVSFAAANTTRRGTNLLEFNDVTDTHWMPTAAVRATDFAPVGPRPLPAVMESKQVYQYSPDGGATWRYLAGGFILRRTLYRSGGDLRFSINKVRIHSVTEDYKP